MEPLEGALILVVVLAVALSIAIVRRLDGSPRRWRDVLRERLYLGVPWGTLVTIAFVLSVYLFVQDGISAFRDPVVVPYRAWSYLYPLGMATAAFSHASSGHLIGNLVGTVIAAPIAEYAWGHYPRERGGSRRWLDRPRVRAFVVFPLAVVGVGLATSLFALGPVIGFSGVVFAFAGFAIVRYPIVTLVATVGLQSVAITLYNALRTPILEYVARPRPPSPPGWATTAIQGHALGFLVGFLLAAAVFHRRGYRPDPFRLWIAVVIYAFSKSLWAIYWFRGEGTYVLFRGPGVAIVLTLAVVVTLAVTASDRPLLPEGVRQRLPRRLGGGELPDTAGAAPSGSAGTETESPASAGTVADSPASAGTDANAEESATEFEWVGDAGTDGADTSRRSDPDGGEPAPDRFSWRSRRGAAFVSVLLVLALVAGPAVPLNVFVVEDDGALDPERSVVVGDYTVSYDEGVENRMVSVVNVSAFGEQGTVTASGVIVSSPERQIWQQAVSANRLAFSGDVEVVVGGPGWRETVVAEREGWTPVGNETAYQVWLSGPDTEDRGLAYVSDPSRADLRIDSHNVSVVPADGEFLLELEEPGGSTTDVEIPAENESVTAEGIEFERTDGTVYASIDDTRMQVAEIEEYD